MILPQDIRDFLEAYKKGNVDEVLKGKVDECVLDQSIQQPERALRTQQEPGREVGAAAADDDEPARGEEVNQEIPPLRQPALGDGINGTEGVRHETGRKKRRRQSVPEPQPQAEPEPRHPKRPRARSPLPFLFPEPCISPEQAAEWVRNIPGQAGQCIGPGLAQKLHQAMQHLWDGIDAFLERASCSEDGRGLCRRCAQTWAPMRRLALNPLLLAFEHPFARAPHPAGEPTLPGEWRSPFQAEKRPGDVAAQERGAREKRDAERTEDDGEEDGANGVGVEKPVVPEITEDSLQLLQAFGTPRTSVEGGSP